MAEIIITINREEQEEARRLKEMLDNMTKEQLFEAKGFLLGLTHSSRSIKEAAVE